jgi:DNA-binding XRE family transcriptional regulator
MMLVGRIAKEEGPWWSAEVAAIGAFTQGRSRKDAAAMLADLIETMVDRPGFKVTVSFLGDNGGVVVEANEPARLAAQVLKYQREVHRLSLADVAKLLGATSRNAYARYEQGQVVPSIDKLYELLRVVAPEMALVLAERKPTKRAKSTTSRKRRAA